MIARRVERGIREGDLVEVVDPARVASFYNTVLTGLSVQARDGASAETMNRVIDDAMALWDVMVTPLARPPESALRPRKK